MHRIIDFDGGLDQIFFVKMENICNKKNFCDCLVLSALKL